MPLQSRTLPAARGRRSIDIPDSRRKSNRENIEAELVCLRTRKFVRQESDRISPRAASADEVSDPFQDHRRCTRRGMVESIREAARKAKVFEMRLIGRRSFWPTTTDDGGNLCTERIERPLPPAHGANRRVFLFWQHREDLGDAKRVATNLRKRKKHGKSTPPNEYKSKQLLEKSIHCNSGGLGGLRSLSFQRTRRMITGRSNAVKEGIRCSSGGPGRLRTLSFQQTKGKMRRWSSLHRWMST